jgi:hypothetical protein
MIPIAWEPDPREHTGPMSDDTGNFADRKAEAAKPFQSMPWPWWRRLRAIWAAGRYAEDYGLELTETHRQAIVDMRREMRELGFPEEVIDVTPGLEPRE